MRYTVIFVDQGKQIRYGSMTMEECSWLAEKYDTISIWPAEAFWWA